MYKYYLYFTFICIFQHYYTVKAQIPEYKGVVSSNCSLLTKTFEFDIIENSRSQSIVQLPNNSSNFILERQVNGNTIPAFVTLDSVGNIISARQLNSSTSIILKTHRRLANNGFIAIGIINNSGLNEAIIVRLDSNFNVVWSSKLQGNLNVNGQHIIQTNDGGFAFACFLSFSSNGSGPNNAVLCRLSSSGTLLWQRQYQLQAGSFTYDLKQDTDGGFLVNGFTGGPIYDGFFFKTDSTGLNIIWSYRHGGPNNDTNISTHRVSSNEYIAFGYNRGFSSFLGVNMFAIRFNSSNGQVIWSRQFGTSGDDITTECIRLQDGNFLMTAVTNVDKFPNYQNIYIKISPSGNLIWSSKNSSNASLVSELEKVAEMQDNTFRATATDYGTGSNRAKIFAFNCLGQNSCSVLSYPVSVSTAPLPVNIQAISVLASPLQYVFLSNSTIVSSPINKVNCPPPAPCSDSIRIINNDTSICEFNNILLTGTMLPGASHSWLIGNNIFSGSSLNYFANSPGSFFIKYRASIGTCVYEDSINIQVLPRPAAPFLQSAIICSLDSILIGTPALPGLTYEWSPQINLSNPFLSQTYFKPPSLNPLSYPISYLLNVTNTNTGCQNTAFQNIFFQTIIQPTTSIKSVSTDFLLDQDIVLLFSRTGINQDSIYVTRDSTGSSSPLYLGLIDNSTNEFRDLNLNTSNQIYRYYVNEKLNCITTRRTPFHQTILLRYDTVPSSGLFQLKWNKYVNWPVGVLRYEVFIRRPGETGFSLLLQTIDTSIIIPEFKQNITFGYRVRAIRADQQASSWSNILEIRKEASLFIPNMVTMNGDGFNDLFKIENLSLYAQNQLQILNRWGRVVFKSDNYQNNWPPSDVVAGAYYYVLDLSGPDESYKGWIEVLK